MSKFRRPCNLESFFPSVNSELMWPDGSLTSVERLCPRGPRDVAGGWDSTVYVCEEFPNQRHGSKDCLCWCPWLHNSHINWDEHHSQGGYRCAPQPGKLLPRRCRCSAVKLHEAQSLCLSVIKSAQGMVKLTPSDGQCRLIAIPF